MYKNLEAIKRFRVINQNHNTKILLKLFLMENRKELQFEVIIRIKWTRLRKIFLVLFLKSLTQIILIFYF